MRSARDYLGPDRLEIWERMKRAEARADAAEALLEEVVRERDELRDRLDVPAVKAVPEPGSWRA